MHYLIKKTDYEQFSPAKHKDLILEVETLPTDYQKDYFLMEQCPVCGGLGEYEDQEYETCDRCQGIGYFPDFKKLTF